MIENNASSYTDDNSLTTAKLDKLISEIMQPTLYYAISDIVPKGEIVHIKKGDLRPEFIVCRQKDFDEIKDELSIHRPLMPLNEYKPSELDWSELARKELYPKIEGIFRRSEP